MKKSDAELMALVARGDPDAGEELYLRYRKPLLLFFSKLLRHDRSSLEDFVQETFFRLLRGAHNYDPRGKFTTYLFTIARNLFLDLQRKKARRPLSLSLEHAEEVSGDAIEGSLRDKAQSPSDEVWCGEIGEIIKEGLSRLSEAHRMTVILSEYAGLSYLEIAETMGVPVGTVSSRKTIAFRKLREILGRKLDLVDAKEKHRLDTGKE